VLKLIYYTAAFGPIHLEYDQPVIRVGCSEDNDLVLRHPSVEPHHCLLVFRDDKVLCLSPAQTVSSQTDLRSLAGPEFGLGEEIKIGALQFSLAHSAKTVAIPEIRTPSAMAGTSDDDAAAGAGGRSRRRRYYCAHCRVFFLDSEIKRLGLVGHVKHCLCPQCSHPVDLEPAPPKPKLGLKGWLRKVWRLLTGLVRPGER
jgi:hypothetical protein